MKNISKIHLLGWLLVPVLVATWAYITTSKQMESQSQGPASREPAIEMPSRITLGEQETGKIAMARFAIANAGGGVLILNDIHTNCACSGLEHQEGNQFRRIEEVRLGPREKVELTLRIAVHGKAGEPQLSVLRARTNDPSHPTVFLQAIVEKVKGGATTLPTTVVFGTLPIGARATQIVDIFDGRQANRRVARIESSRPDRFNVRLLPNSGDPARLSADPGSSRLIARAEVIPNTKTPSDLSGEMTIYLDGEQRPPDIVAVLGRVAAPVELSPTTIFLPRSLSDFG